MATVNGYEITKDWKTAYNPLSGQGSASVVFFNSKDPTQRFYGSTENGASAEQMYELVSSLGGRDIELRNDQLSNYFGTDTTGQYKSIFEGQKVNAPQNIYTPPATQGGSNTGSSAGASGLTLEMQSKMTPQQIQEYYAKIEGNNLKSSAPKTTSTQTSTATTQPKPFGLENITGTLNLGSQSTQVKELQKWLAGNGYVGTDGKPLKEDGIYGTQTKAAVMQFQSKNGLVADGIFGPKSLEKSREIASTSTQINSAPPGNNQPSNKPANDPSNQFNTDTGQPNSDYNPNANGTTFNTGDTANDALLAELQSFIKAQQDAGLKLNAALNFDQATLNKFMETAKKQVQPFYQSQIDNIKADVIRAAPQILANYDSDIKDKEANFQNSLDTSRENNANAGLAFSGGRAKGEFGMQDSQNRDLVSLNQAYGNKLYDLGRGAEEKIGSSNANYDLGALRNYSANLGGNGGFILGSSSLPYASGGIGTGSLQYDMEQSTEARRQALLKSASESVVAGRSYNDLFA